MHLDGVIGDGDLPEGEYVAPLLGVNFVEPWPIFIDPEEHCGYVD